MDETGACCLMLALLSDRVEKQCWPATDLSVDPVSESPVIGCNPMASAPRETRIDARNRAVTYCLPCRRSWVRVPSAACAKPAPGADFSFLGRRSTVLLRAYVVLPDMRK